LKPVYHVHSAGRKVSRQSAPAPDPADTCTGPAPCSCRAGQLPYGVSRRILAPTSGQWNPTTYQAAGRTAAAVRARPARVWSVQRSLTGS